MNVVIPSQVQLGFAAETSSPTKSPPLSPTSVPPSTTGPTPTLASTHSPSSQDRGNGSVTMGTTAPTTSGLPRAKRVSLAPPPSLLAGTDHGSQGSISTQSSRSSSSSSLHTDPTVASPETTKNRRDRARSMFRRQSSKTGTSWEDARAAARQRCIGVLRMSAAMSNTPTSCRVVNMCMSLQVLFGRTFRCHLYGSTLFEV